MAREAGIGARQGLWGELTWTLRRLERLAVCSVEEVAGAPYELHRLQYSLHLLTERLVGVRPAAASLAAHAELADALACARDATAELAEAAESEGAAAAVPLVYEWRGALFRLRLARMLLAPPRPEPARPAPESVHVRAALTAFLLTLAGCAAVVSGALLATWALVAAGVVAVAAGLLVYRP
jgi:hypothetical protein